LSMVASRAPFGGGGRQYDSATTTTRDNQYTKSFRQPATAAPTKSTSLTDGLISNLACMALKRRLKDQTHVSCDLTADGNALLMGRVGPVTVKGRGWRSSLGLTCRAIEATVDECRLDMARILTHQKLVLTTPCTYLPPILSIWEHVKVSHCYLTLLLYLCLTAEGRAMVALSADDFGNFITHPLMMAPSPPRIQEGAAVSKSKLEFMKENVELDPLSGTVTFYGTYAGATWEFALKRDDSGANKAIIQAALVESSSDDDDNNNNVDMNYAEVATALTETTSKFFNEMVFELDGTFLSFNDMMLTGKGPEPSVMLSLLITVKKFPSPGLEF
ncbi:MAG: hypothetical protein SGILL_010319, partial [Bacillariaceae sp.]